MLNFDIGEIDALGTQIGVQAEDFRQLLSKIQGINAELASAWQGSDASQYTNAVAEQAVVMQKLAETIAYTGERLRKISAAYAEAQSNHSIQ